MKEYTITTTPIESFPAIAKALAEAEKEQRQQPFSFHFGFDVELKSVATSVLIDGGNTHYFGKRERGEITALFKHLVSKGHKVVGVQESCGFGPYFHRDLQEVGGTSYLIAPFNVSGKRKTDRSDAVNLGQKSYDFDVNHNPNSIIPILDIGEQKRQFRTLGRHREQLVKSRNNLAGCGRGLMNEYGFFDVPKNWWGSRNWVKIKNLFPEESRDFLLEQLIPLQDTIQILNKRAFALEKQIIEKQNSIEEAQILPKGLGELTAMLIYGEVADWNRFSNRKQVGSFTGLCSGERSSGGGRRQGNIDRKGNSRIRKQLVEAVWRLKTWNQDWHAFKKNPAATNPKAGPASKKKAVVACARILMIDLWRLNTGQTTLDNLGLVAA